MLVGGQDGFNKLNLENGGRRDCVVGATVAEAIDFEYMVGIYSARIN